MKLKLLLLSLLVSIGALAQTTNTPPPIIYSPIVDFLSRSNLIGAAYGIYDTTSHKAGGGLALAYQMSDFIVPTLRVDYINDTIWNPSASIQLQMPLTIVGRFHVTPFVFDGIATVLSGKGNRNMEPENIAGIGAAIGFGNSSKPFYVPKGIVGSYERWSGAGFNDTQFRLGAYWKF